MILVFGGTTEGRMAVEALEEAGKPYYYSTKCDSQKVGMLHGIRLWGAMKKPEMVDFCRRSGIRLLVDAAHPFAQELHRTVKATAEELQLPVVRLERFYLPEYHELFANPLVSCCRDYEEAMERLREGGVTRLLALTGVNTIEKLRYYWELPEVVCFFRILQRDSSKQLAAEAHFPRERLVFYKENSGQQDRLQMERLKPQAILLKESGLSSDYKQKMEVALQLGIRVFVVRRPVLPASFVKVDGPHGLRRAIEKLLPEFYDLHTGVTTGTCTTAAMLASLYRLAFLWGANGLPMKLPSEVPVILTNQETIQVPVQYPESSGHLSGATLGLCVKDAGDDPDVTNGMEIFVEVCFTESPTMLFQIEYVEGVGTVTLPGLGLPVGAPAVNKNPQKMFHQNVTNFLLKYNMPVGAYVFYVSLPQGKELAKRTFNPRLGVEGGISIIGSSGIVKPFSSAAFVASIRKSLEVALASGTPMVVINSGAKSEGFLRSEFPNLPTQAFVHYGNFIGDTLQLADELKVPRVVMGVMLGKAVKLAEGHLDTHSKHTVMNKEFLKEVAQRVGCCEATLQRIDGVLLAREMWQLLEDDHLEAFMKELIACCHRHCDPLLPNARLDICLISELGELVWDQRKGDE